MSARKIAVDKVIALRGDDPLFWLDQGHLLLLRHRHRDAAQCFDQALVAAPDDLVALNARARTHLAMGEIEPARSLLEQACAIDEGIAELWNNLGTARARGGDAEGALESFERALALSPGDASVLCNRAMALVGAGDHERALEDLARAVQREPQESSLWSYKGATHLRAGQLRMARQSFQQSARLSWSDGDSKRKAAALMVLAAGLGLLVRARGV